jgi:hypothetical protein
LRYGCPWEVVCNGTDLKVLNMKNGENKWPQIIYKGFRDMSHEHGIKVLYNPPKMDI